MMTRKLLSFTIIVLSSLISAQTAVAVCPYDPNCLNNPYGAGSPYKADGLMNPYSQYGSPYSNKSGPIPMRPTRRQSWGKMEAIMAS